ncbi:MAG: precorrin-8X methylmutase [Gammaproteobacteria bacterium]|nr:precorrin-8X methylmutase [Gammaproteobacteria bacterium]
MTTNITIFIMNNVMQLEYEKNPQAIEQQSFEIIRSLTTLDDFDHHEQQIAMRMVHTCGDPHIVKNLRFICNASQALMNALKQDTPILCDVEMLASGLSKQYVNNSVKCFLNDENTKHQAKINGESRCMTAVNAWTHYLQNSICAIGNAPTAAFRLIELINQTGIKPACIVAIPVGFVGAKESKQAIHDFCQKEEIPAITLLGHAGGSAITAAVINAAARMNWQIYY